MDLTLVVLAGGASTRMGSPKALLPFRGAPWIEAQLRGFAAAAGREAIVVISDRAAYRALPWIDAPRVAPVGALRVVEQPRPTDPPFASLLLALRAMPPDRGAFVLPIDVPVCGAVWASVARGLGDHDAAVPAYRGRRGHPVAISASFAARLASLDPRMARLDHELDRCDRAEVAVDEPTVVANLNTPEAWERWVASADAERCYPARP